MKWRVTFAVNNPRVATFEADCVRIYDGCLILQTGSEIGGDLQVSHAWAPGLWMECCRAGDGNATPPA